VAKKAIVVILDITFPDDLTDPDYGGAGVRLAVGKVEIDKIIQAGCVEESFDYEAIESSTGVPIGDMAYDLVTQ